MAEELLGLLLCQFSLAVVWLVIAIVVIVVRLLGFDLKLYAP